MRKFLAYIFIAFVLVGLFRPTSTVMAAPGACVYTNDEGSFVTAFTKQQCEDKKSPYYTWDPTGTPSAPAPATIKTNDQSAFEKAVTDSACGFAWFDGTPQGCVLQFVYWTFYTLGGWLLAIAATMFNFLIKITLDGGLLNSPFVSHAWGTVRDLSNIFFLLVLIYIGIKIILGMGGHGVQKMVANVVIMALLINFSMFMTKIVIDSSNILALVFYNKIKHTDKTAKDPNASIIDGATGTKDLSGGLTESFNPVYKLKPEFFNNASNFFIDTGGKVVETKGKLSIAMLIGITVISAAIMLFAAYALFISALSFLGRLVELFVLIIFSPFAFMSFSVHELEGVDYIGWKSWFHRLLSVSFMAPIFMFMLYFIFLLLGEDMFKFTDKIAGLGVLGMLLSIIIPALVVLTLLLKATEFAKKGSGKFGELAIGAAKVGGGLALGAATGGAALALTGTLGKYASNVANDDKLKERAASGDKGAQRKLALANATASRSFDFRQTSLVKYAAKKSGLDLNAGTGLVGLNTEKFKEGRKGINKEIVKKLDEKRKTYMLSDAAAQKQDARAEQYKKDKDSAKKYQEGRGVHFDENVFKKQYEAGGEIGYGLYKQVNTGSIKNAKGVNDDRQKAYAISLDNRTFDDDSIKTQARKMMNRFWDDYKEGVGMTMASGKGLAAIATAGALTGGLGAAATPLVGGFVHALKEAIQKGADRSTNAEVAAKIRKGVPNTIEHALHELNEAAGIKHDDHGAHEEKHEEHHPPTAAPTAHAATDSHPPAH